MRSQKGASLLKIILIGVAVIAVIIFIVKMSEPQDGIRSVEEETKSWEKSKENLDKANDNLNKATENYINSKKTLESLEK